jgi:hypothetical protein
MRQQVWPRNWQQHQHQWQRQQQAAERRSPVPMKLMGDLVAATADSAPPPLAWPSILVTMTWPTCRLATAPRSSAVQLLSNRRCGLASITHTRHHMPMRHGQVCKRVGVLTHVHGLSEGCCLVVRRLPDAGVHHEDDQVLQEVGCSLQHAVVATFAASWLLVTVSPPPIRYMRALLTPCEAGHPNGAGANLDVTCTALANT